MKTENLALRIVRDDEILEQQITTAIRRLEIVPPAPEPEAVVVAPPVVESTPVVETPPEAVPGKSITGRLAAWGALIGTLVGMGWLGVQIYLVLTDSWVAPLHLSPNNDAIVGLRLQHTRNQAELARLDAEVARADSAIAAVETATQRLVALRGTATDTLHWRADESRVEAGGLATTTALMQKQRAILEDLRTRQTRIVERTRDDLKAGIVDRTALDRDEQTLDQLALQIAEVEREIAEAELRRKQARTVIRALDGGKTASGSRMPEVAAGDEHSARIEIEIERLAAEGRGHRANRQAAAASAAAQRSLLAELEARPLYRAMKAETDVAFVPYDQLDGVKPGAVIVSRTWAVFACEEVGRIKEVMGGEVVTQDPWGEMARGQYAVLELTDREAIRERVLRVRK